MSTAALKRISWEEYVARERNATQKSEFYDGEMFAMAGGTPRHGLIGANVIRETGNALRHKSCQVYSSDVRVMCPTGLGTYPDCSIVCGEPEYLDTGRDTLINPIVLFEVLSPTTEAYDRGKKFRHYQTLPSLREYVLISQDDVRIEHFARQSDSSQWLLTVIDDVEGSVMLPALGVALNVAEVYAKVTFDEVPDLERSADDRFLS